jgi:catechol 2,3-dioxygenase-like lactoylglutathione lyase family enzyme
MLSGRPIDHVVLAVRDLARTAKTYEGLGFKLTPRAFHEDRMGTSNHLAPFTGRNFIELLEVDRPGKLIPHDFVGQPPFFSFGDHNRLAVSEREGLAMLVFATTDARADLARFEAAGLQVFAPVEFERQARLPDGTVDTAAFTLGFARSPEMRRIAFFVCENRAQQFFWKQEFQTHENGAQGIKIVYLSSPSPERDGQFISRMFGGEIVPIRNGVRVSCGSQQEVQVITPDAVTELDASLTAACTAEPLLAGIRLVSNAKQALITSSDACGMFVELIRE